ncbi:sulfite reductase subunit alpha [Cephaloticoccus primus]|uniref:Sulfite reductase subunit alpha n=1 Tax=Cephaloticoccus primus TaxID=1548207 RepID=A0A139SM71_9BACT|nr:flavodoxin domain-containing protein [Cephaloticoccus primus]KXU35635.1 sulfite reductase subunit alpha [Cephaloticoccus primus]
MPSADLIIYFGTVTGNAESLALRAQERAQASGLSAELVNLAEIGPDQLIREGYALFFVSTWGDGEPPMDVDTFYYDLEAADIDLSQLSYAMFGLGDSDYPEFNGFARNLDERLASFGAQALYPRAEADVFFDDTYAEWEAGIFPLLEEQLALAATA